MLNMSVVQQKTQLETLQTGTWSKVFPKQYNTETKSCTFVKKLIAVAISNIAYLRCNFPEKVFSNRTLDGLPLKILKQDAGFEAATNLVNWLRGAFEALENRYLRELMLIIYLDPKKPNQVHEMYTFRFSYSDGDRAECQLLQGTDKKQIHTVTDNDLYKATHAMLLNIIILVQSLGPLPDSAFMIIKLSYYDEVTPIDYEPQGFCPTQWTSSQLPTGAVSINLGEVSTNFHTIKLRVKVVPKELLIKESKEAKNTTGAITTGLSASEPEPDERFQQHHSCCITEADKALKIVETKAHISDTKCICKNNHWDNIMLLCTICQTFQHGACYKIVFQSDIPERHICVQCSVENEKLVCTDRKLARMASNEVAPATFIFRRALAYLLNVKIITKSYLKETLGIDELYAEGVMAKLVNDKIVAESVSGKHNVDSEILQMCSLPKYLGIRRYIKMNCTKRVDQAFNQNEDIEKEENKDVEKEEKSDIEYLENKDTGKKENKATEKEERNVRVKRKNYVSPSSKRPKCSPTKKEMSE